MIFLREKCREREREWVDYGEEKKKGSGEKGVGG
jgi:predicted transcriptional regulator